MIGVLDAASELIVEEFKLSWHWQAVSLVFALALAILVVAILANLTTAVQLADLSVTAIMVLTALVLGYCAVAAANRFSLQMVSAVTAVQAGCARDLPAILCEIAYVVVC